MSIPTLEAEVVGFWTKWALWIVAAVVAVVALLIWFWWHNHEIARNAAALPQAQAIVSKAQTNAGQAAINTVTANQGKSNATDQKTATIVNNYNTYPAAKVVVDPAFFDAFRLSICLYKSATDLPQCQRLQQPDTK